jgi:Raf kinase inhibitor-like YbhB/YbcL family protein
MSEFSIICPDFKEGKEIPKKFGYKLGNVTPIIEFHNIPEGSITIALIMDDPDAMGAVGKIWVHWLVCNYQVERTKIDNKTISLSLSGNGIQVEGKTDFGVIGYGGPAPPDKRHTYIFKGYVLDMMLDLKEGYSKQDLENAMKGHIIAEAKLTGTFAP